MYYMCDVLHVQNMCITHISATHVLYVQNMYITHVSATHVIHLHFCTCNTPKYHTCITGVAQLAMFCQSVYTDEDIWETCIGLDVQMLILKQKYFSFSSLFDYIYVLKRFSYLVESASMFPNSASLYSLNTDGLLSLSRHNNNMKNVCYNHEEYSTLCTFAIRQRTHITTENTLFHLNI